MGFSMLTKAALTKENFYDQMLRYGFLYEQIPRCFTADSFADNANELLRPLQTSAKLSTAPFTMSIYKSALSKRSVSIPNPQAFAAAVKYLGSKWTLVKELAKSENSQSPITFITTYNDADIERVNSEDAREAARAHSDFVPNVLARNALSLGLTVKLSVDLHTFYDSIYTHSLSWAICGKPEAKRYHSTKQPPKPTNFDFADKFDRLMRNMKSQETNGILTGPYTSRIFSELLLAGVDHILAKRGYVFRRYVDDYSFYFETDPEARQAVSDIEDIMREFGLKVNHDKTTIDSFPFDTLSNMKSRLERALGTDGVFGLLNEASLLHLEGDKGAYKYALKMLRNVEAINREDAVIALLFNIGLSDPKQCCFVTDYMKRHVEQLDRQRLSMSLNQLLRRALDANREQEVVNLLSIGRELSLPIMGTSIARSIESSNDLARIIALDYWKHANSLVVRSPREAQNVNSAIAELEASLTNESFDGEHWLLLFESESKSLLSISRAIGRTDSFIGKMASLDVSFYKEIGKPGRNGVFANLDAFYRA